ncbi:MAG TPA: FG-GAP-like repeat-containing protein [Gemmatimonadaceae bacterium]|nr:FG-GAP-like repeat-containing protein [Gemmatimonadaceae bacterium]
MTRRSRLLYLTLAGAIAFIAAATGATVRWRQSEPTYRPGEDREGITSELTRNLPPDYPRVAFTDVTRQAGIAFTHFSGRRTSQLPEDMGSGAAWADYDNDGWMDLVVSNEVGPITLDDAARRESPARARLYHNERGRFTDVTVKSGIDFRGWGMGVAWGDYDNDGYVDLVLTAYGHNVLYHNNGDGTFSDRSLVSRVGVPEGFWTGASWGDYDRDGLLDLYVTGYVKYTRVDSGASGKYDVENPASINPSSFAPERNLLFHNDGNGVFSDVAAAAGVTDTTGRGLSAAWADFDSDGWIDLYVANDQSDNAFFRNLGNGKFRDISHAARVADYRSAMGIAVGDWNNDGTLDLFLTHWIAQENALYTNQLAASKLTFMDEADRVGLGQISLDFVGWATSFTDYDNDGKVDLFVVNGSTLQDKADPARLVPMRNQLFWNRGRRKGFFDVSPAAGPTFGQEFVGRGAAFADYDNDGDDDIFIVNHGGPGILLRNDGGNRHHWMQVQLRGSRSNRQGFGALVRVVVGDTVQTRQVGAQSSYLSQNSLVETFGLGGASRVDTLEVRWPSGARDVRTGVVANARVEIVETIGSGGAVSDRARVQRFWALYREASALRVARQTQRASNAYARALELDPRHEDVLYYYGATRLALGDFDGAAKAWRTLTEVNPHSARGHSELGSLHMCADAGAPFQLDSAEWHLTRAHEINKEETGPLLHLGEVALLRGNLAVASRRFDEVLVTHGGNTAARFYSGYVEWKRGNVGLAEEHFARAITAAASATPTAPVPGEGDTKRGLQALTVSTRRCAQLSDLPSRLRGASTADLAGTYRDLQRILDLARSQRNLRQ